MPYVDIVKLVALARACCGMLGWGEEVAGLGLKALFGLSDFVFDIAECFVKALGIPHVYLEGSEISFDGFACMPVAFRGADIVKKTVGRFIDQIINLR